MMNRFKMFTIILAAAACTLVVQAALARVVHRDGKTFILDRTGRQWDVSQAKELGFRPEGFQFGIGMNAFTPLADTDLSDGKRVGASNRRVIGVADGDTAHAYAIDKLRHHEIANTSIGSDPITVGY